MLFLFKVFDRTGILTWKCCSMQEFTCIVPNLDSFRLIQLHKSSIEAQFPIFKCIYRRSDACPSDPPDNLLAHTRYIDAHQFFMIGRRASHNLKKHTTRTFQLFIRSILYILKVKLRQGDNYLLYIYLNTNLRFEKFGRNLVEMITL